MYLFPWNATSCGRNYCIALYVRFYFPMRLVSIKQVFYHHFQFVQFKVNGNVPVDSLHKRKSCRVTCIHTDSTTFFCMLGLLSTCRYNRGHVFGCKLTEEQQNMPPHSTCGVIQVPWRLSSLVGLKMATLMPRFQPNCHAVKLQNGDLN